MWLEGKIYANLTIDVLGGVTVSYEFNGQINVSNVPENEDAIKKAVTIVLKDDYDEDEDMSFMDDIHFSEHCMEYYGTKSSNDEIGLTWYLFSGVTRKIMELYPDCSLDTHLCGTNMGNDMEDVYTVQLQNRHVKELDVEMTDEWFKCPNPDCDGRIVSFGEFDFDREYDCDECGQHFSVEEMNEIISDYVGEYDVSQYIEMYK